MNKIDKLTRLQKIQLLQAIKTGKIAPESLQPPRTYIFIERSDRPGIYVNELNGKEYTEQEYEKFIADVKAREPHSLVWHEGKAYHNEFITLVPAPGCEPIADDI